MLLVLKASSINSGVASPKIGGGKMFDFRRITLLYLAIRLSKHKMAIFSEIWRGMAPLDPPGYAYVHETCMFLAFSPEHVFRITPTNEKSAFIELTSFKSLVVKFQASTLDQCHNLFINLSCISASKPLNAQYCTKSSRPPFWLRACYTVFARFWCAPTQHVQPGRSSDFALRHWLPK